MGYGFLTCFRYVIALDIQVYFGYILLVMKRDLKQMLCRPACVSEGVGDDDCPVQA